MTGWDGAEVLDGVRVVLVRARNPNNIGAVARAMHDFGFRHLRVVNEYTVPFERARSAVDAGEVVARAQEFRSLPEAVADCTSVVGTTAVGERVIEHPLLALPQAAERLWEELGRAGSGGRVALVFGSEKTGLSNEELSCCQSLLTIPMQEYAGVRHASMNLGQAVAVCLYQLRTVAEARPGWAGEVGLAAGVAALAGEELAERRATAGDLERVTGLLAEVLGAAEYHRHHPAHSEAEPLRRLVLRMGLAREDVPVWMGMLRQVLWKLRGGVRPER